MVSTQEPGWTDEISDQLKSLISGLLDKNANSRVTLDKIKVHQWFRMHSDADKMNELLGLNEKQRFIPIDSAIVKKLVSDMNMRDEELIENVSSLILSPEFTNYRILKNHKSTSDQILYSKIGIVRKFSLPPLTHQISKIATSPTIIRPLVRVSPEKQTHFIREISKKNPLYLLKNQNVKIRSNSIPDFLND